MKTKSYTFLWIILILNVIISPLFIPNGGLIGDIQHYVRLAYYLPDVKWSLYPLGYPFFLRAFYTITGDYYWAGRLINILCFTAIGLFAYLKSFHFKETVILLCAKIFIYSYFNILSEGIFLCLMYFLFYILYQYFYGQKRKQLVLAGSLLMILLFSIRYSALYIYFALCIYYVFYYFSKLKQQNVAFFKASYFWFLFFSGAGIFLYALFNYLNFGDVMGEGFRNPSDLKLFTEEFYIAVFGLFNAFNPVLAIKSVKLTPRALAVELFLLIINFISIGYFVKISKNYFRKTRDFYFYGLIIFIGISYLLLIFLSSFYQGIDNMDMRILCEGSFCFFYVFIFIYYKEKYNEKVIFCTAVFSFVFNTIYAIKIPKFYLTQKYEVEKKQGDIGNKKYFFDDIGDHEDNGYKIPLTNKIVRYNNPYVQSGFINAYIIMTKYPQIYILLDESTVNNKELIIYNSQLQNAANNEHKPDKK
ncbi:hypothetical protein SAMN05660493_01957 [Epilithonimonas bovis DSM 19482]|uniref:Dolichyl-phosphate-mannose-protein mannosyltransferase n=1 Tax=Epilithonimonas bovis DSM 19482 TaxID=1121284 RepID=A0A1U7PXL0_9FLAO|nr:hypothetical protein [Epilithonimonas bovis]SIT97244.1 hypothetical protein SAMN05660493_01957 [Epilithonimonas bovis DSM 19482]